MNELLRKASRATVSKSVGQRRKPSKRKQASVLDEFHYHVWTILAKSVAIIFINTYTTEKKREK